MNATKPRPKVTTRPGLKFLPDGVSILLTHTEGCWVGELMNVAGVPVARARGAVILGVVEKLALEYHREPEVEQDDTAPWEDAP